MASEETGSISQTDLETVFRYHEETKHHFHRFARSMGYLDWANQPDPFRRYEGAEKVLLPFERRNLGTPYEKIFDPNDVPPRPPDRIHIGCFFELSLALSAWKEYRGERWSLRINPSSGNLHPTEGYLVCGPITGLFDSGAVCHYQPADHSLEVRRRFPAETWRKLSPLDPDNCFLVGLCSIHWREAWKYGERAFRYCHHDVGHALAALRFSAAVLGWRLKLVETISDEKVGDLLGVNQESDYHSMEREVPDLLAVVSFEEAEGPLREVPDDAVLEIAAGPWHGIPNRLSREHFPWPIIDEVHTATRKPPTQPVPDGNGNFPGSGGSVFRKRSAPEHTGSVPAQQILFQRRSAVAMDGKTFLSKAAFFDILEKLMPDRNGEPRRVPPWDAVGGSPRVDVFLFVHRVRNLSPGVYCLLRDRTRLDDLKTRTSRAFEWTLVREAPDGLPLYRLLAGDCRQAAAQLSCTQAIASDGVFSVSMVAYFERSLRQHGAWYYRRMFWESGMIGQVLYLEAEVAGIRGTGIGCFFDDPVHDFLGLRGRDYQALYHFTLGGPVEDTRLATRPPYTREQEKDPRRKGNQG